MQLRRGDAAPLRHCQTGDTMLRGPGYWTPVRLPGLARHWNPALLCDPSQKGRFSLAPQRQRETAGFPVRSQVFPSFDTQRSVWTNRYFHCILWHGGSKLLFEWTQNSKARESPSMPGSHRQGCMTGETQIEWVDANRYQLRRSLPSRSTFGR